MALDPIDLVSRVNVIKTQALATNRPFLPHEAAGDKGYAKPLINRSRRQGTKATPSP